MARKQESSFTVDLDRIEEGIAVLLAPDNFQWHLPENYLPGGVSEGMSIRVILESDGEATEARLDRIRDLRSNLVNR